MIQLHCNKIILAYFSYSNLYTKRNYKCLFNNLYILYECDLILTITIFLSIRNNFMWYMYEKIKLILYLLSTYTW